MSSSVSLSYGCVLSFTFGFVSRPFVLQDADRDRWCTGRFIRHVTVDLEPTDEDQEQENDDNQTQSPAGRVAPLSTVRPSRKRAHRYQYQQHQKDRDHRKLSFFGLCRTEHVDAAT